MTTTDSLNGPRDGVTFDGARDAGRLNRQAHAVFRVMADGRWHTLHDLSVAAGAPEASCSARLRDLRKPRFGRHRVERDYLGDGLWQYRLLLPVPGPGQQSVQPPLLGEGV
jgi:hypothetical protein